jgi:hypothetical protein
LWNPLCQCAVLIYRKNNKQFRKENRRRILLLAVASISGLLRNVLGTEACLEDWAASCL